MTAIILRKGPGSEWSSVDPVLGLGEPGFDTTTKVLKMGDGTSKWSQLKGFVPENLLDEKVQDVVALMLDGNYSGITFTYDDATGEFDVATLYRGVWTAGTYQLNQVTSYQGRLYRSTEGNNITTPGAVGSKWEEIVGGSGNSLAHAGEWSAGTYEAGSVVSRGDYLFSADVETDDPPVVLDSTLKQNFSAGLPISDSRWTLGTATVETNANTGATPDGSTHHLQIKAPDGNANFRQVLLEVELVAPGNISFLDLASTEANYDVGHFSIDGVTKHTATGQTGWVSRSYALTAGVHTIKWMYQKDSSGAMYQDLYAFTSVVVTNLVTESDWTPLTASMQGVSKLQPVARQVPVILIEAGGSVPAGTPVGAIIIEKA